MTEKEKNYEEMYVEYSEMGKDSPLDDSVIKIHVEDGKNSGISWNGKRKDFKKFNKSVSKCENFMFEFNGKEQKPEDDNTTLYLHKKGMIKYEIERRSGYKSRVNNGVKNIERDSIIEVVVENNSRDFRNKKMSCDYFLPGFGSKIYINENGHAVSYKMVFEPLQYCKNY